MAKHRHLDRLETTECHRVEVDLMMGLYSAMPVWLANDAPKTINRSDSFMNQLAMGVLLRTSTPQPSSW